MFHFVHHKDVNGIQTEMELQIETEQKEQSACIHIALPYLPILFMCLYLGDKDCYFQRSHQILGLITSDHFIIICYFHSTRRGALPNSPKRLKQRSNWPYETIQEVMSPIKMVRGKLDLEKHSNYLSTTLLFLMFLLYTLMGCTKLI